MDYYKCENCGKMFDEFEMDFQAVQIDKMCLCDHCRKSRKILYEDGEPCSHHGCRNHLSHKCESCGRIMARGTVYIFEDSPLTKFVNK